MKRLAGLIGGLLIVVALLLAPRMRPVFSATLVVKVEAEAMTRGNNVGTTSGPFNGINLCCNGAYVSTSISFANIPGRYRFDLRGASSAASSTSVSLVIGGSEQGVFSFPNTTASLSSLIVDITTGAATQEIQLLMKTDTGANDALLDYLEVYYEGVPPTPTPVPPPARGSAYATGNYQNLFKSLLGKTDAEVQARVDAVWSQLFYGDASTQAVYYPVGTDMAYIKDIGNGDIRSEGMSYGMMIAVQLNKKVEFDRLWKWAKTYMQHQTGERKGYFAWQMNDNGTVKDQNPASDGEEYFATALFFADARWGSGSGIFNYRAEANAILDVMLHKEDQNGGVVNGVTNMFNKAQKQVVFTPYYDSAAFTDPSYHLPAFYELWGRWAPKDNGFWFDAASSSRAFFQRALHPTTGLNPDYANFDGTPKAASWDANTVQFRFDAWRTIMNVAVDYAWFGKDSGEVALSNRLLDFFYAQGVSTHGNRYTLDGTQQSADHSPGLVAMNAVAALASTSPNRAAFVQELWNTAIPSGQWRYYDGMLYTMAMLHVSGNFKIYTPGAPPQPTATNTGVVPPSATRTNTAVPATTTVATTAVPPSATRTNTSGPTATRTNTAPPSSNLLLNPGFETDSNGDGDPDNWTAHANVTRSSALRRSGSYSIRHQSTSNNAYVISQVVNGISAGAGYSFSGYTSIPATSDAFTYRIELVWRNSSNATISTSLVRSFSAGTSGAWTQASGTFVAPSGATNVVVRMNVSSLNATIYSDDFSLTRGAAPATATRTSTTAGSTATATATQMVVHTPVQITSTATRTNTPASATATSTSAPPTATSGPSSGLRAQYRAAETQASSNQIKPHLNIVNGGTASVALSELKARYYYSKEGTTAEQYFCDYAVVGCGNVTGTFASGYLEVGFTSGAGSLAAGAQTGEIQSRFAKTDWSNYTQTGDYSFDPTKTSFADWTRVTLHRSGALVWGTAP